MCRFRGWKWTIAMGGLLALVGVGGGCGKKLAQVNGVTLTQAQFYDRLMKEYGRSTLMAMIMEQLVLQEAQKQGLLPTDQEIQKWLADFKQSQGIQNDEQWIQFLQVNGWDDADLLYKGQVEMALFKLQTAHLHPTEAQLQSFFKQYQRNFNLPPMIRFRQIVVDTPDKVNRVREKLAQGFDFGALAKQYSIDPHAQETGGDVGLLPLEGLPVPQEQGGFGMPPELFRVIQDLPVEKPSGPVPYAFKDANGKEVKRTLFFLVTERRAGKVVSYKEVQDRVRLAYLQSRAKPREEIFQQLAQKADVIIYEDRFRAFESQFGGKAGVPQIPLPAAAESQGRGAGSAGPAPSPPAASGTGAPASGTVPSPPPTGGATGPGKR